MSSDHYFELRCSDVHPHGCATGLRGRDVAELVEVVREHGMFGHGYTSVFYDEHGTRIRQLIATRVAASDPLRARGVMPADALHVAR